ncbi:MAG: hypothetical protein ABI402_04610 [Ferruginibacter sp.]
MKKIIYNIALLFLLFTTQAAYCQKYKTAADTIKLNKEYLKLIIDTADLKKEIAESQENLKKYQADFESKDKSAKSSAEESSRQADKATNGEVKDAKKAKKKAKDAYDDAKAADNAKDKKENEEKKLKKLNKEFDKKQDRLKELNLMQQAINNLPKTQ